MRAKLLTSRTALEGRLGAAALARTTFPRIFLDAAANLTPALLELRGQETLLINDADLDALEGSDFGLGVRTFGRYFVWNADTPDSPSRFERVAWALAEGHEIDVESSISAGRYRALAKLGPVHLPPSVEGPRRFVQIQTRKRLLDLSAGTEDVDLPPLRALLSTLTHADALRDAWGYERASFDRLDATLMQAGVSALLITSPFNVELFSGLPSRINEAYGISAVYVAGEEYVFLLSESPLIAFSMNELQPPVPLSCFLRDRGLRSICVEDGHLSVADMLVLEGAGISTRDGAFQIRRWQEYECGKGLPYFAAAANGVLAGIEVASEYLLRQTGTETSELDLAAAFHRGVYDFGEKYGLKGHVLPYFDIIHSGERTLRPALAGAYPVSAHSRTITFDMGLLVVDSLGRVRSCSDIARTLSPEPAVNELVQAFRGQLLETLIPAIKPGLSGGDMHKVGVEALRSLEGQLVDAGMMSRSETVDGYTRDCGHTIQRQTPATVQFLPNAPNPVDVGMLGCTEFVWPLEDRVAAIEDAYYVTSTGGVPFTV